MSVPGPPPASTTATELNFVSLAAAADRLAAHAHRRAQLGRLKFLIRSCLSRYADVSVRILTTQTSVAMERAK